MEEMNRMVLQTSFRLCEDDLSTLEEAKGIAEGIREDFQYIKRCYPDSFNDREGLEELSGKVWGALSDFLYFYKEMRKRVMD